MTLGAVSGPSRNKKGEIVMGKLIKDISAPPDHPMFTGVTFISAIMRPELSPEVKPKKTKMNKGKKKNNGKDNRERPG
jgi:hypothetical protein